MKQWNRLGKKRQNEILIALFFGVLGLYLLGWHWQNYNKLAHAENMVNRAENRLQLKADAIPEMPKTAGSIDKELGDYTDKQKNLGTEYDQISSIFLPFSDVEKYQSLRLSISDLAENLNIRVNSVTEINQGEVALNTAGNPTGMFLSKRWGRPLINYQMNMRFIDLLNFLEGLETLEYQVSSVSLEIEAELAEGDNVNDPSLPQYLNINLVLAL